MKPYPKVMHDRGKFSEWIKLEKALKFACCDCGLIHRMLFSRTVKMAMMRDDRATAARRRGAETKAAIKKLTKRKAR